MDGKYLISKIHKYMEMYAKSLKYGQTVPSLIILSIKNGS